MRDLLNDSAFWQGVLASIAGGGILILLAYVIRITFSSVREWWSSRTANTLYLKRQLVTGSLAAKQGANIQILFSVLQWSIIAALLWVISSIEYIFAPFNFVFRVASFVFLVAALRWVLLYQKLIKVEDEDITSILQGSRYRLYYNPKRGAQASKIMTFGDNSRILEGQNQNEYSWRIEDGKLEFIQKDGAVHSRFSYGSRNRIFNSTNDPDTPSTRDQYLVPEEDDG